jgi:formylmethanofuran dehydrogenase subunit A
MPKNNPLLAAMILGTCALALPLSTRAASPPDAAPVILIQNATILTVSHGTIEHGSVLIRDGKIAEVGASIKAPKDALVVDAAGQFVIPGIIDCHSHIAVERRQRLRLLDCKHRGRSESR